MSLTSQVNVNIQSALASTVGLAPVQAALNVAKQIALANGVGANQADAVYSREAVITTGGTLSIDLAGSLTDALGAAFAPVKLKAVLIHSLPANTTDLTLFGNAASPPILNTPATTMTMKPGGLLLVVAPGAAGIAITPTTADIVQIVNAAGASATVQIVLIGTSA